MWRVRGSCSRAVCILACLLIQPWYLAVSADASHGALPPEVAQTADILGIRQEAEQIISLHGSGANADSERHQLNDNRALVLRKIFEATLQLKAAESQLEIEIDYTQDAIAREQRKVNNVNQFFNTLNFAQLGVLYGMIEPYSNINGKFTQSAICTTVGAGVGTLLPVIGIIYNKYAKASHLTPPAFMSHYLNGKPVDGSSLPPLVVRYLDSPAPGDSKSRREVLNTVWKQRFKADMAKKDTLFGIDDGKARNQYYLNNRLVLLWSLSTAIGGFNHDLLSLLNQVRDSQSVESLSSNTRISSSSGLGGDADDAARLLHLEPVIVELNSLNVSGGDSVRKRELQITLLETLLWGSLDMAVASDTCQQELNYQYDVVLAKMTARQGNVQQKLYEANFIQTGALSAIAGYCYLKGYSTAGNEIFLASDGIGLGFTAASFMALSGGWRKNETGPNSLADFFDLKPNSQKGFSPLVMTYLNSPSPSRTDGKSRRQYLLEFWSKNVATFDLKNRRTLEKLGSMPSCKRDTIKLVLNRIALLSSLREQFNEFDVELLDLLRKVWPVTIAASSPGVNSGLSPSANAAATLLGVQGLLTTDKQLDQNTKLLITRQVLDGFLSMNADADVVGHEIDIEYQVLDRMVRQRDRIIQLTNNVNFLQLGILGIVSGSLGLSNSSQNVLAGNHLTIISGYMLNGLALATILEQRGGFRPGKAEPNALSVAFGKGSQHIKLSPVMVRYLNSVSPVSQTNLSRREELTKYWKESKVLNVNIKRDPVVQKLSAEGKAHHWWSETINLINNRITMLFDLRAVLRSSSIGFDELLKAVD